MIVYSLFFLLLTSCATQQTSQIRSQIDKPQKIIINLTSGQKYDEEWRLAFESLGYETIMSDEVNTADITVSEGNIASKVKSVVQDEGYHFVFDIRYEMSWDIVYFVKNFTIRVRDLRTKRMVATFSDSNFWAHPSIESVVKQIESEFLQAKVYK